MNAKNRMVLTLAGLLILVLPALGQGTTFTYQGRLEDAGAPANGQYGLRFRLFDAATGGTQVGSTLCFDSVHVVDGLFEVRLNFGQQFVTNGERHLDIQVRAEIGQPCTDDFGYVLLLPRQQITAAPFANSALFANQASSAFTLSAADGSPSNVVFVDNNGKVGVGTLTPTHSIHIANPEPTLALQDTDSTSQQVGYLSYRDSTNAERGWIGYGSAGDPDLSIINARTGGDIVLNTFGGGKIGIGTSAPTVTLDVRGDIRFGTSGQFRAVGAGEENLRIIRGTISQSGGILRGGGFTVQRIDEGKFTVTFNTPFAAIPTVTATALRGIEAWVVSIDNTIPISTQQVTLVTYSIFIGDFADGQFDFIAIGPR